MVYDLRPVSADDLPMLRRWLSSPEAVRWWGDPEEEYALIEEGPANARARRAYAKAGVVEDRVVQAEEGAAVLMVFKR